MSILSAGGLSSELKASFQLDSPLSNRSKTNKVTFKPNNDYIDIDKVDNEDSAKNTKIYFNRQNLMNESKMERNSGELIFRKLKPSLKLTKKISSNDELTFQQQQQQQSPMISKQNSFINLNNKISFKPPPTANTTTNTTTTTTTQVNYFELNAAPLTSSTTPTNLINQSIQHAKIQFYDSLLNRSSTNLFLNNYLNYASLNRGSGLYKSSPSSLNELETSLNGANEASFNESVNFGVGCNDEVSEQKDHQKQQAKTKAKNSKLSDLKPELLKRRISIKHFANVEKQNKSQSSSNLSKFKMSTKSAENQLSIIPEVNEYFSDKIKLVRDESVGSKLGKYGEDNESGSLKLLFDSSLKDCSSSFASLNRSLHEKDFKSPRLSNYSSQQYSNQRVNVASSLPNLYSMTNKTTSTKNELKMEHLKKIQSQLQLENSLGLIDKADSVYKFTKLLDRKIMDEKQNSLRIKFPNLVAASSSRNNASQPNLSVNGSNEKSELFNSSSFVLSESVFNNTTPIKS